MLQTARECQVATAHARNGCAVVQDENWRVVHWSACSIVDVSSASLALLNYDNFAADKFHDPPAGAVASDCVPITHARNACSVLRYRLTWKRCGRPSFGNCSERHRITIGCNGGREPAVFKWLINCAAPLNRHVRRATPMPMTGDRNSLVFISPLPRWILRWREPVLLPTSVRTRSP